MLTRLLGVTIFSLCILNCTHVRHVPLNDPEINQSYYEAIRKKSETQTAKLVSNRDTYSASNIYITPDSTHFIENKTGSQKTIATNILREISFRDRGKGVLEGIGIGLSIGFGIGFPIGYFSYTEGEFNLGESRFESGIAGGVAFSIPSTVIGLIAGAAKGSENKYIMTKSTVQKY